MMRYNSITMEKETKKLDLILIIVAACFWGSMGIFVRRLTTFGFNSIQIVSIRITLAALIFSLFLVVKERSGFKISLRDIPIFLGLGLGIMSALLFHEKMNSRKIVALLLAFGGCVLVSGVSGDGITFIGVLLGLGSGIGYGLYSILGTIALRKYSPYTVTTYTFVIAAVGSWFISKPLDMFSKFERADNLTGLILFCILTALVTAVIPFLCYTLGLRSVEASKAGIIATIEPVVATIVGIICFSETLTILSGMGIVLVLAAVIILNTKSKK